jgi:hypothetical protein
LPAYRIKLGRFHRDLKRQGVAVVDALAAPMEQRVAVPSKAVRSLTASSVSG